MYWVKDRAEKIEMWSTAGPIFDLDSIDLLDTENTLFLWIYKDLRLPVWIQQLCHVKIIFDRFASFVDFKYFFTNKVKPIKFQKQTLCGQDLNSGQRLEDADESPGLSG